MGRWGDLAQWRGPTINEGDGDGRPNEAEDRMAEVRGVILHIAEGWYEGTIGWCKNPASDVSAHFVAGRAGQRAQLVDTDIEAWTQVSGNGHWLSVEFEGFSLGHRYNPGGWERLTDAQVEFAAQVLARAHRVYGVPLQLTDSPAGRGLGHHSMGGAAWGGHYGCPGTPILGQKPAMLARAAALVGAPVPAPVTGPKLRRAWPGYMPLSHYFGLITGPNESHGGYYWQERPDVRAIQQRLIVLGYVPGVINPASSWADGLYEQATVDAVARWQRARYAHLTTRYGEVWLDDWVRLFTY